MARNLLYNHRSDDRIWLERQVRGWRSSRSKLASAVTHTQLFEESIMKKQQGFTLIELMIVVAIIAILAAIALPAYQDYIIRSQVSEGTTLLDGVKTGFAEFYNNTGRYPGNNGSAGLATNTSISGSYVSQVNIPGGGLIQATFSSTAPQKANAAINGGIVELSATTAAGSVAFKCKAVSGIVPRYLPTTCR